MTGHNRKEELLSTMPLKHGQAGSVQNQTVAGKRLCDRPSTLLADIKEKKKHCFRRAMNHLSCNTSIKYFFLNKVNSNLPGGIVHHHPTLNLRRRQDLPGKNFMRNGRDDSSL